MVRLLLLPVLLWSAAALAASDDSGRVVFDYQMNCQGCHTPDGAGAGSVPAMQGHVGVFLQSQAGREYLVRVPGSATSALSDERLAAVLNWIVYEFAGDSLQSPFTPYTAAEVAPLRKHPLNEVDDYRQHVLRAIAGADARE
ncbi:cytochrome c, class I [Haliea sp. E1-2-M8]|uniref:c-type cytochrome n=1 Tax=Haliea sp. E1-2-M8 TaxID=3064706 RepID=UPI002728B294|nr:cytochrome c, class I [Haliea sp. E1-2-M8]MDO8861960.1 cytochrome c, class I [Haliea sp. E1-2-M8]